MRPRLVPVVLLAGLLTACGDPAPAIEPGDRPSVAPSLPADGGQARAELAARAALAEDHRFSALYTWDVDGSQRSVVATVANDGSWRVDIPGGARGGTADVSVVQTGEGLFQCALPSATSPTNPSCVRVADPDKRIPDAYDPKIQRVFRQWLPVFTDRQAALSVVPALPLAGSQGRCYSIEGISASLAAPVDVGIYCYADTGLLTAVRVNAGTLTLSGAPAPAPPKVDLPGPVVGGEPMGMASPPPPPAVSPSGPGDGDAGATRVG
ncbi:MAG TPA: hypothetical protein VFH03_28300 [Actinoplanes sp.]|nr:hypothetical protein [Actinoplanes sp.]